MSKPKVREWEKLCKNAKLGPKLLPSGPFLHDAELNISVYRVSIMCPILAGVLFLSLGTKIMEKNPDIKSDPHSFICLTNLILVMPGTEQDQ